MKLRAQRVSIIGDRLPLVPLDERLHEPPRDDTEKKTDRLVDMIAIPGARLRVCRDWAEAMGYMPTEERFVTSMGDGGDD